jgi:hypothetical protein
MPDLVAALMIVSVLVSLLRLLSQTGCRRPPDGRDSQSGDKSAPVDQRRGGVAEGGTPPGLSTEYALLSVVDKVREAVRLRDSVETEWTEYVEDIRSVYLRPLLEDVTVPASARFWQCRERVEHLAPMAEALLHQKLRATDRDAAAARATQYLAAVVDLATAWSAADENARAVGIGLLDNRTKLALGKVRSLLNRARDERTGAAERENCRQRIIQILGDLEISIPGTARERALAQLAPSYWRQLTAAPLDFGQPDQDPRLD